MDESVVLQARKEEALDFRLWSFVIAPLLSVTYGVGIDYF